MKQRQIYPEPFEGILPINKPAGKTAFSLVTALRRCLRVRKIGHAGTLDPFATGVMLLLVGKNYTRLSNHFLQQDKEYLTRLRLGIATDSFDCDGKVTATSDAVPSREDVEKAIERFQGTIEQIPPMFSAKKVNGKKLYELARAGKTVDRRPQKVTVTTVLKGYSYPYIDLHITCSKGTYIRSLANEIGALLHCGGHLESLVRVRSGTFHIDTCFDGALLNSSELDLKQLIGHLHQGFPPMFFTTH